jgi:hypothetical protein
MKDYKFKSKDTMGGVHVSETTITWRRFTGHTIAKEDVAMITVNGAQRTNVGAVVAFGVLGLGAKKANNGVSIMLKDGDAKHGGTGPPWSVRRHPHTS